MLQDLSQVRDIEEYSKRLICTVPTSKQAEEITNIAYIENVIRHVPILWRTMNLKSVQERGWEGIEATSIAAENIDDILNNPNVVDFVQMIMLLVLIAEAWTEAEEPDLGSDLPAPSPEQE